MNWSHAFLLETKVSVLLRRSLMFIVTGRHSNKELRRSEMFGGDRKMISPSPFRERAAAATGLFKSALTSCRAAAGASEV